MPIVIDWDDTLLPSTHLSSAGYTLAVDSPRCPVIDKSLEELEHSIIQWLSLLTSNSTVIIITNAERNWVERSCQKFLPNVWPFIEKCKVISARSQYELSFPGNPMAWKLRAFIDHVIPNEQIVSYGDSQSERQALRKMGQMNRGINVKSIKFVELPSIEALHRQIKMVTNCNDYIFNYQGELDLMLTISVIT